MTSVSVVIPAYRAAETIGRAVDSVLGQSHAAAEILVVDDGSPDDVAGAVASYGSAVTLVPKENGGAASARNLGIERATGDLIAFLDADDYWEPAKLERHVARYADHPDLGLTCGAYFNQEPGAERQAVLHPSIEPDVAVRLEGPEAFKAATRCWTGTVVVPRVLFGEDRFVSGLEPAEDRDLWVRLIAKAPTMYLSEPLATAVLEPGSLSRSNVRRDCENMLRVVHRNRDRLGAEFRRYEVAEYRRWAANLLGPDPRAAIGPAMKRLRRQPFSAEGWWVLAKAVGRSCLPRGTGGTANGEGGS